MQSKAATVSEYLVSLSPDRQQAIEAVRAVILRNLDKQYEEGMSYGMIGYYVPHRIFPAGYHCDPRMPLGFAGLASQKNYMSIYLMGVYYGCVDGKETDHARWFREAWAKTGKKLDMGKCCIRFKRLEDLPLDVIGEAIRRVPAKLYVEWYEKVLGEMRAMKQAIGKSAVEKPTKSAKRVANTKPTEKRKAIGAKGPVGSKTSVAAKRPATNRKKASSQ